MAKPCCPSIWSTEAEDCLRVATHKMQSYAFSEKTGPEQAADVDGSGTLSLAGKTVKGAILSEVGRHSK